MKNGCLLIARKSRMNMHLLELTRATIIKYMKPIYEKANITLCAANCAILEIKRSCHLPFTAIKNCLSYCNSCVPLIIYFTNQCTCLRNVFQNFLPLIRNSSTALIVSLSLKNVPVTANRLNLTHSLHLMPKKQLQEL